MGQAILLVLRALAWGYCLLPRSLQLLWARFLGWFLARLKLRMKVVEANLKLAYPEDEGLRKKLKWSAYEHLGRIVLEVLAVLGPFRRYVKNYCELRGREHWVEAQSKGNGVIYVSSHVGNWEIMAASGSLSGMDLMLVTKKIKPSWLHSAIENARAKVGVSGTYEPRTARDVLRHLGKGGTVGMVLDQYAGAPMGVRVPFFGVPVGTASTVATFAKRTGAPVLPVVNYRTEGGRYVTQIYPALEWISDENSKRELALNTARYVSVLETHVREHPEQWLWIHRRFKGDLSPLRPEEWEEGRSRGEGRSKIDERL